MIGLRSHRIRTLSEASLEWVKGCDRIKVTSDQNSGKYMKKSQDRKLPYLVCNILNVEIYINPANHTPRVKNGPSPGVISFHS